MSLNRNMYLISFKQIYLQFCIDICISIQFIQFCRHSTSVYLRFSIHFRASLLWMLSSLFSMSIIQKLLLFCLGQVITNGLGVDYPPCWYSMVIAILISTYYILMLILYRHNFDNRAIDYRVSTIHKHVKCPQTAIT